MKKIATLLILLLISGITFSQIQMTEFFLNANSKDNGDLSIIKSNEEIFLGAASPIFGDSFDSYLQTSKSDIQKIDGRIVINRKIVILGQPKELDVYWISNFHFTKPVIIRNPLKGFEGTVNIENCVFENGFDLKGEFKLVNIRNSKFQEYFSIQSEKIPTLKIQSSEYFFHGKDPGILAWPDRALDEMETKSFSWPHWFSLYDTLNQEKKTALSKADFSINIRQSDKIFLEENSFYEKNARYTSIFTLNTVTPDFLMTGNRSELATDLNNLKVSKSFTFYQNKFNGPISISNMELPEFINKIKTSWDQFSGLKLSVFERESGSTGRLKAIYRGKTDLELKNTLLFLELTRSYQILLNVFKTNGDLESVNGCFAEMKDVQGARLKNDYSNHGGFKRYFRWKLNWLMKTYTNHGTDPALSIIMSFYVMLGFAAIFFFYPSDWDVTSKSRLLSDFKDFIHKNDKGYISPFFKLSAGFILSLINALTLSINSFTTLGFGNIPTHGIARYLCIVEGFLGWFLLSIFTVALINQVSI